MNEMRFLNQIAEALGQIVPERVLIMHALYLRHFGRKYHPLVFGMEMKLGSFKKGARRQDIMCQSGCFREEQIIYHQQFQ